LSERIWLYLATDLSLGEQKLDEDEFLTVRKMPLETLVDAVLRGEILDGKTQTAVLRAYLMLQRKQIDLL
jgi:ADP-ribose pyrophosphatase